MRNKTIKLRFLSTLKHVVEEGEKEIEIGGEATVEDLLRVISTSYGARVSGFLFEDDDRKLRNDILILVNDRDIGVLDGVRTILSDDDEVTLMPVAHGG